MKGAVMAKEASLGLLFLAGVVIAACGDATSQPRTPGNDAWPGSTPSGSSTTTGMPPPTSTGLPDTSTSGTTSPPPPSDPQVAAGQSIYYKQGCSSCHSIDGTQSTGPTFKGLWGKTEKMNDGSTELIDARYVKLSLINPHVKIVAGYPSPSKMPVKDLPDSDIAAICAYLKSLQ
jgi:cytochrome c oxidase subunit 2